MFIWFGCFSLDRGWLYIFSEASSQWTKIQLSFVALRFKKVSQLCCKFNLLLQKAHSNISPLSGAGLCRLTSRSPPPHPKWKTENSVWLIVTFNFPWGFLCVSPLKYRPLNKTESQTWAERRLWNAATPEPENNQGDLAMALRPEIRCEYWFQPWPFESPTFWLSHWFQVPHCPPPPPTMSPSRLHVTHSIWAPTDLKVDE